MGDNGAWRTERGTYERPTQNWVCGWARDGHHCRWGPSPDGQCLAISDCVPRRDGGRWQCTRPEEAGGPCADGPEAHGACGLPARRCQPARSHRALRGLSTRWVAVMTVGILTAGFVGPWQHEFVSTGELSLRHAPVVEECTGCHDDHYPDGLASLPAGALATNMSDKCVVCHDLGKHGDQPHSLARPELQSIANPIHDSARNPRVSLRLAAARSVPGVDQTFSGQIACASCHTEHRGTNIGLREWSNDRCQVCHQDAFESFANGHPDLSTYPYSGRTRIIFDHVRHRGEHYGKTGRSFDCTDCHAVDGAGQRMTVGSFERTCVDCHGNKETSDSKKVFHHGEQVIGGDPVALFTLPRLDLQPIKSAGTDIGAWPTDGNPSRTGLTRLGLTPFTELMLSTEADAAAALGRLKLGKTKLAALKRASEQDIRDTATIAWATKRLLADLNESVAATLQDRLESPLQRRLRQRELAALAGQLPPPLVRIAVQAWFPAGPAAKSLADDLAAYRREPPSETRSGKNAADAPAMPGIDWIRTGPWQQHEYSLQYRASGHDDDFIKTWLNICLELINRPDNVAGTNIDFSIRDAAAQLFDQLADPGAKPGEAQGPGRCTKCHSRASPAAAEPGLLWTGFREDPGVPAFTRFSHAPHLHGAQDACQDCHRLNTDNESKLARSKYLEAYLHEATVDADRTMATGNFAPIGKQDCGKCHAPQAAGDGCLVCHNYHAIRPSN